MKKVLWLDVDGVLLDYTRPFLRFASLPMTYETLFDYDLRKLFVTQDECNDTMLRFAMSKEFAALPSIATAHLLVALKNVGYELRVITKLPSPNEAKINRIMNLSRDFGPVFSEIVFTGSSDCKLDYLAQRYQQEVGAEYILVEDNPELLVKAEDRYFENLEMLHHLQIRAIRHPYNEEVVDNLMLIRHTKTFDEVALELIEDTL
jgi:hypothetical protein